MAVPVREAPKFPKSLVRVLTQAEAKNPDVKTTMGRRAM